MKGWLRCFHRVLINTLIKHFIASYLAYSFKKLNPTLVSIFVIEFEWIRIRNCVAVTAVNIHQRYTHWERSEVTWKLVRSNPSLTSLKRFKMHWSRLGAL